MPKKAKAPKTVAALKHKEAKRTNIPTAEYQSVVEKELKAPVKLKYPRTAYGLNKEKNERNKDLDPQLMWRGKDSQDWSDLVVNAPPLYIQEKVKPKILIDDLRRQSVESEKWRVDSKSKSNHSPLSTDHSNNPAQPDLFADFNGLPENADKTDFYHYQGNWQNRMILGDSLQVMASLAEREGLRGKVQCIYLDPPYGIKFNSNFQWSTTSRDVKDGKADHITREPEQVKAFRDTWRDGIHSYLTYLRDRLTVARDLLTESGSIFVQIGDENVHRVRAVMDEVFGEENFSALITVRKTGGLGSTGLTGVSDFVLWYAKHRESMKWHSLFTLKTDSGTSEQYGYVLSDDGEGVSRAEAERRTIEGRRYQPTALHTMFAGVQSCLYPTFDCYGKTFHLPRNRQWSTTLPNMAPRQNLWVKTGDAEGNPGGLHGGWRRAFRPRL